MSADVFPVLPGLGWSVLRTPMFSTGVQTSASGQERRTPYWSYPTYRIELMYEFLHDDRSVASNVTPSGRKSALRTIEAFFKKQLGSYTPFWFTDPTDYQVVSQTIATGDGTTKDFPVVRTEAGNAVSFAEPVGAINPSGFTVTVGGSGASPTLNSPYDGWLHFGSAPANAAAIVVTGSFYYRCRFDQDEQEFGNFMRDLWEAKKVTLRTVKL